MTNTTSFHLRASRYQLAQSGRVVELPANKPVHDPVQCGFEAAQRIAAEVYGGSKRRKEPPASGKQNH